MNIRDRIGIVAKPTMLAGLVIAWSGLGLLAQTAPTKQPPAPTVNAEKKITAAETQELFKSIDEILEFVSKDTGLPIKSKVKREIASREQVQKYIEERMAEDEDNKRLERSELVLKKFGLLARDFKLRPFMITLLRDQVAGFYDSKLKTVHLLDWIDTMAQKPVMAHELTHALQDQSVDLDDWVKKARAAAKKSKDRENAEVELDEEISARSAMLEGQGMAVMLDYVLLPQGRSLKDSPQFAEMLKVSMSAGTGSAVLNSAPLLLKESLVFPYRDGLGFIQALLKDGGAEKAYPDALRQPPRNTRDILSPESYLENQALPVLRIPPLEKVLGKAYAKYDVGSIGQFDIVLMAKQFSSNLNARELSPAWRGGYYYSALRKNKKSASPTTNDLALIYVSRWASPEMAHRFADLYIKSLNIKYASAVAKDEKWESEEGPLSVEVVGDMLIVMESFDAESAAKLRSAVLSGSDATSGGKVASSNLSLKVVAPIFGARLLMH